MQKNPRKLFLKSLPSICYGKLKKKKKKSSPIRYVEDGLPMHWVHVLPQHLQGNALKLVTILQFTKRGIQGQEE